MARPLLQVVQKQEGAAKVLRPTIADCQRAAARKGGLGMKEARTIRSQAERDLPEAIRLVLWR